MTGTPIQNNLTEFWALLDWVTCGQVLGDKKAFMTQFSAPIIAGQNPKASLQEVERSSCAAKALLNITRPLILQRKKTDKDEATQKSLIELPTKTELTVWVPLSTSQRASYGAYLEQRQTLDSLAKHEERNSYPVEVIGHLRSLTRHPFLLELTMANTQRKALKAAANDPNSAAAATPDISRLRHILNSGKKPKRPLPSNAAGGVGEQSADAVGNLMATFERIQLDGGHNVGCGDSSDPDSIGLSFDKLSLGNTDNTSSAGQEVDQDERQYLLPPGAAASMPVNSSVFGERMSKPVYLILWHLYLISYTLYYHDV